MTNAGMCGGDEQTAHVVLLAERREPSGAVTLSRMAFAFPLLNRSVLYKEPHRAKHNRSGLVGPIDRSHRRAAGRIGS